MIVDVYSVRATLNLKDLENRLPPVCIEPVDLSEFGIKDDEDVPRFVDDLYGISFELQFLTSAWMAAMSLGYDFSDLHYFYIHAKDDKAPVLAVSSIHILNDLRNQDFSDHDFIFLIAPRHEENSAWWKGGTV
ncbi:hypothetical protein [Candidatus Pyrohabitans sp.]